MWWGKNGNRTSVAYKDQERGKKGKKACEALGFLFLLVCDFLKHLIRILLSKFCYYAWTVMLYGQKSKGAG